MASSCTVTDQPSKRRHRRVPARNYICQRCSRKYTPTRSHAKFCSHACRTGAWRWRKPHMALITWGRAKRPQHQLDAQWRFFSTRAAALAAAPDDEPEPIGCE